LDGEIRMTGKRFKLIYNPHTILWDNLEDKDVFAWAEDDDPQEIVDKLNELYEENEQLRHDATILLQSNQDYRRENEQLLKEMGDLGTAHAEEINKIEDEFDEEILKLEKENDQLKKRISDYADITAITTHILNEEKEIAEEGIVLNVNRFHELVKENEQLRKENQKLESLWEDKCIREYMGIVGEYALQEMHDKKYGDKE
jgi:regulator of replication initiation timing